MRAVETRRMNRLNTWRERATARNAGAPGARRWRPAAAWLWKACGCSGGDMYARLIDEGAGHTFGHAGVRSGMHDPNDGPGTLGNSGDDPGMPYAYRPGCHRHGGGMQGFRSGLPHRPGLPEAFLLQAPVRHRRLHPVRRLDREPCVLRELQAAHPQKGVPLLQSPQRRRSPRDRRRPWNQ